MLVSYIKVKKNKAVVYFEGKKINEKKLTKEQRAALDKFKHFVIHVLYDNSKQEIYDLPFVGEVILKEILENNVEKAIEMMKEITEDEYNEMAETVLNELKNAPPGKIRYFPTGCDDIFKKCIYYDGKFRYHDEEITEQEARNLIKQYLKSIAKYRYVLLLGLLILKYCIAETDINKRHESIFDYIEDYDYIDDIECELADEYNEDEYEYY